MATRKKTGTLRFDRRIRLWKPREEEYSSDNPYNEKTKDFEVAYPSYPARRLDGLSEIDEKETGNLIRAVSEVEWELQYIPKLELASDWRIEDLLDGIFYEVTSPPTGIGRGLGYRVITVIVE